MTWALAVVLTATTGATCLAAVSQTAAQRACCAAMAHECGDMALESACCATPAGSDYALIGIPPVPVALPTATLDDTSGLVPPPRRAAYDASPVRPPGIPTYLFVSSFRI